MYTLTDESAFVSPKILGFSEIAALSRRLGSEGKKVALCHGGFDLMHAGHIAHFQSAKKCCDVLIVSVTSDRYVTKRKGDNRPVFSERIRAYSIAALACVDYVVISDFERGVDVLEALHPAYYVKGDEYRNKQTQGITRERACLAVYGGEMLYTTDPRFRTTGVIECIRNMPQDEILMVLDRDGTLIREVGFLGREDDWKEKIELNMDVVSCVSALQRKYKMTTLVITNQSGVARGFFGEDRVREIHSYLDGLLCANGIKVDAWRYCPEVDAEYAKLRPSIHFRKKYVTARSMRKPDPGTVMDELSRQGRKLSEYAKVLVLGDREEDRGLAANLGAVFVDVTGQDLASLFAKIDGHYSSAS